MNNLLPKSFCSLEHFASQLTLLSNTLYYLNHFTPLLPGTFCTNESNWIQGAKCSKKQSDPEGKMCWGAKCSREQNVLRSKKRWGVKCPQGAKCSSAVRKNRCIGFGLLNWFELVYIFISYDRAKIKKIFCCFSWKTEETTIITCNFLTFEKVREDRCVGFILLCWTGLNWFTLPWCWWWWWWMGTMF